METTDTVVGSAGEDTVSLLVASAISISKVETLVGSTGNDTITLLVAANTQVSGVETVIGASVADTVSLLVAGNVSVTGVETVFGTSGADTITMLDGSGAYTFAFASGDSSSTATDQIVGWTGGNDKIDFGSTSLAIEAVSPAAVSGTASIDSHGLATFFTSDSTVNLRITAVEHALSTTNGATAGECAVFVDGAGNTYLFISDGADGVSANDLVIKLVGMNATTGIVIASGDISSIT
ncbi:hypothetical protein CCP3SC1AL1_4050001 [Gammaproteobacteria bacterium]